MSKCRDIPKANLSDPGEALRQLSALVTRLRAPDGCPWDRGQTLETFKHYLIEETHELLEALSNNDSEHVREELGDLLFQVLFLTELYQEQQAFGLSEVINGITAKMIRRHPHVFGDKQMKSEEELRRQWQSIKNEEKNGRALSRGH